MQVFTNRESIGAITKFSNTIIRLAPSTITMMGIQLSNLANLSCDISSSGAGGLDTGSVAANSDYYLYAVNNSGTMALVASLSPSSPSGFSQYKKIGFIATNNSSQVMKVIDRDTGVMKLSQFIHYHGGEGHGSVATKIPYFTTMIENSGDDILPVGNNSTDGFSVTCSRDNCNVNISYLSSSIAANQQSGISINATDLTADVLSLSVSERLISATEASAGTSKPYPVSAILNTGEVIRPHTRGFTLRSTENRITINALLIIEPDWS